MFFLSTLIAINWNVNWSLIIYSALAINGKLMDELDDNYMSSNRTLIAINWNVNWTLIIYSA